MRKTTNAIATLLTTGILPLLGACDPATDEPSLSGQPEFRCAFCCTSCGVGNSPNANGYPLTSIMVSQSAPPGVERASVVRSPNDTPYTLDVVDDEFVARTAPGGTIVAAGVEMVGWRIELELPSVSAYNQSSLYIAAVDDAIPAWSISGGFHTGYSLLFMTEETPSIGADDICGGDGTMVNVLLIEGETYDVGLKTVNPAANHVTLACAGEAVAKMKMFNFGPNDSIDGNGPATWQERQATIKMLTADYCGDGTSYTEPGTLVEWINKFGTTGTSPDPGLASEAWWNENGAMCLDMPRVGSRGDIACAASLPTCDSVAPWTGWVWNTASDNGD